MGIFYKKSDIPDHLQKYFVPAEIGLEQTPEQYIAAMVEVFRCVRDVLADDGTLWLNIGDSYAANRSYQVPSTKGGTKHGPGQAVGGKSSVVPVGLKPKDLIGIPWLLAFALRADGWYLRQDIIWAKPNPMPESVRDRCTKAHEYVFLLSKSERYFFDSGAMKEPAVSTAPSGNGFAGRQGGSERVGPQSGGAGTDEHWQPGGMRNRRSVWSVATKPYAGAHFATFPEKLIEPCILAGSRPGDIVLDPFMGSGTTAAVAIQHGRQYLGCELNAEYGALQAERINEATEAAACAAAQPDLFERAA